MGGPGHHLLGEFAPKFAPNTGTGQSHIQLGQVY
jgi:hypothetical protein